MNIVSSSGEDVINLISSDEDDVRLPKAEGPSSKSRKGKEVPRGEHRKSF